MEQIQNHDDFFEVNPFSDATGSTPNDEDIESDFEDDFDLSVSKSDTSASEARSGKDIQGIPWERLNHTRNKYRQTRLKQYMNYENLSRSRKDLDKECKEVQKGHSFYDFQFNTRLVKSTIVHFQKRSKEILNVAKPIEPTLKSYGSLPQTLSRVQICTMSVKDNFLVAGGFRGELICKYLNQSGVVFCTKVTTEENAITNAVDIYQNPNGEMRVVAANNDSHIRIFDTSKFACISQFLFPWSVNNTSVSPDGRLLAVLGDSPECLITDSQTGRTVSTLKGHMDYSFASAWHPDGKTFATGNQDTTCRIWDIRNLSESVSVLKGRMGAIRALRFTSDGRFMAMAEPADFVHIFDTKAEYTEAQEIDLFGEIAGISFSPDAEALFIGVADRTYGSLLEYNRKHCRSYLDCIL